MKKSTRSFLVAAICLWLLPILAHAQSYYPVRIVNNTATNTPGLHPYLIFMAQDTSVAAYHCVMQLQYDATKKAQVGSLVRISTVTDSRKYSYCIDSLKGYDPVTRSVNILIPNSISGRCMVSINHKLRMPVIAAGKADWVFQNPSVSTAADANYNIIFDKFEYTYDKTNTFYIDPTAVDFFSIPIRLTSHKGTSGVLPGANRDSLMAKICATFTSSSSPSQWDSLIIKDGSTILRITAPNLAPSFNPNYLEQSTNNYINALVGYYIKSKSKLRIDCSELDVASDQIYDKYKVSPSKDLGAYIFTGVMTADSLWIFKNKPKNDSPIIDTIDMKTANSNNFFGPGTAPFLTTNKKVISIIVEDITAAFTVGLMPAAPNALLNGAFFSRSAKQFYKRDTLLKLPKGSGPWYNLYTQALHNAIPQMYAFAFDDLLGQSGTISSTNNKDTVTITLGNMGNLTVPTPSAPALYAVTLNSNSGFKKSGSNYVAKLSWSVPQGQSKYARYFFQGVGQAFSIQPDTFIRYQYGNYYHDSNTSGTVTIPASFFNNCTSRMMPMAVYTCDDISTPCPSPGNSWAYPNAPGSNTVPAATAPALPATLTYFSGFTKSKANYTAKIKWTNPAGQSSAASYFFLGSGSSFLASQDTFIKYQLGSFPTAATDSATLTIPATAFNGAEPDSIQIYTCGSIGFPCPTSGNLSAWSCDIGSIPLKASVSAADSKRKKKKK